MTPIVEGNRIYVRIEDGPALFDATKDVLRRSGFELDRTDERSGIVTTAPSLSPHFFEFWRGDYIFWRGDGITNRDIWESSLNPIRRSVTVSLGDARSISPGEASVTQGEVSKTHGEASITQSEHGGGIVKVTVFRQRLSQPEREFNNSAAVFNFFSPTVQRASSGTGSQRVPPRWIDIGEDAAFANVVLNRILVESRRRGLGVGGSLGAGDP